MIISKTSVRKNTGGDDTAKYDKFLTTLKETLNSSSLNTLKANCLAIESYKNSQSGRVIIGGLHDRINSMTKEDLIGYIISFSVHNKQLRTSDFEQIFGHSSLIFLSSEPIVTMGGLHDYIYRTDRKTLVTWALTAETHERTVKNIRLLGGLHDRLPKMSNVQVADYILAKAKRFPELNSSDKLNALSVKYAINQKEKNFLAVSAIGGLHDFIYRTDRNTLMKWALASEAYSRKVTHVTLIGGLEDYINSLSNIDLANYILEKAALYKELDSKVKLDALALEITVPADHTAVFLDAPIVGGLDDFIFREPRETLVNWAFTVEEYARLAKNQTHMMGGLGDYINTMNTIEIADYILNKTAQFPELNDLGKLNELTTKYLLAENQTHPYSSFLDAPIVGGLEDFIFREPRETLVNWAFTVEEYARLAKNQTHMMGGLGDYINTMNTIEIADYILNKTAQFPELNDLGKLNELTTKYLLAENQTHPYSSFLDNQSVGGLEDFIFREPRETLVAWALTAEQYSRILLNQTHLLGGLSDYIQGLNTTQIARFILDKATQHRELNSLQFLNELTAQYAKVSLVSSVQKCGGLEDYIYREPRAKLINWALAAEQLWKISKNMPLVGGLSDYVSRLNNTEIAQYILQKAQELPELQAGAAYLDSLTLKYGISFKEQTALNLGGLGDYIFNVPRAKLINWALTAEQFYRTAKGITLIGGLHDYISRLNTTEIAEYILQKAQEYPDLGSGDKLDALTLQYGISFTEALPQAIGGLEDYIYRQPRERLIKWALAAEEYYTSVYNLTLLGGLHDYISRLNNTEIATYVLEKAGVLKELNSAEKLDQLAVEYNINFTESNNNFSATPVSTDYIKSTDRATLIQWALAAEKFWKSKKGQIEMEGGLDDYVMNLTDTAIAATVINVVTEFPELNSAVELNKYAALYGINRS